MTKKDYEIIRKNRFTNDFISVLQGQDVHLGMHMYQDPLNSGDLVNGKNLYENATSEKSYYLNDSEVNIIQKYSSSIADRIGEQATIIDIGPGGLESIQKKTIPFLKGFKKPVKYKALIGYTAIDFTQEYIESAISAVQKEFPNIETNGISLDIFNDKYFIPDLQNPGLFFTSGTIGNVCEKSKQKPFQTIGVFENLYQMVGKKGFLVITQDTNQNEETLKKAYHTQAFENFTLNVLHAVQRDVASSLNPTAFEFDTQWHDEDKYLGRYAIATETQNIQIKNQSIQIKKGQKLNITRSYKHSSEEFIDLASLGGWESIEMFSNENDPMAIHLFKANQKIRGV